MSLKAALANPDKSVAGQIADKVGGDHVNRTADKPTDNGDGFT